jgi:hypothetical protein
MRFIGILTFATAALSCTSGLAQGSLAYQKLSCSELAQEGRAISKRGFVASGLKAGLGGSDGTPTEPAIVIIWPVTLHVRDALRSENLALAFKQLDALEQASIQSQCSIRFLRPPVS